MVDWAGQADGNQNGLGTTVREMEDPPMSRPSHRPELHAAHVGGAKFIRLGGPTHRFGP